MGTTSSLSNKEEATLRFWNVASDISIFMDNSTATGLMKKVFVELATIVHSQGTLIIALGEFSTYNFPHIAGEFCSRVSGALGPTRTTLSHKAPAHLLLDLNAFWAGSDGIAYNIPKFCIVGSTQCL